MPHRASQPISPQLRAAVFLAGLFMFPCACQIAAAQDEPTTDRQRLEAAYKLTQEDSSQVQLESVLVVCEDVLKGNPSDEDRSYAVQLATWALAERADARLSTTAENESDAIHTALSDLNRAIELDSKAWKARLLRAWIHGNAGRITEAIADLDFAVEADPKSMDAWFNRAELHYHNDDFVLSIHDYTRTIVLNPRDAQAYTGRGHAYFQMGKYQEAMSDYQKVVLLTEGSPRSLIHRGDVCLAVSLWDKARDDYQLAAARDDKSGLPQRRLAWLLATCPDKTIANPELAVKLAEKAVERMGASNWSAANTLATAYALAGQTEKSLELLEQWEPRLEGEDLERLQATRKAVAELDLPETEKK